MAVVRVHKTDNYTVMSNYHFKEKNMSLRAKGLLSLMLSLPEDWDYSINGLAALSKDGKDGVMSTLKELESFNYLIRTRIVNNRGQFKGYDYDIYEQPHTAKTSTEKPYTAKPNTATPNTEKSLQLNTNILNTNNINNLDNKEKERKAATKTTSYDEIINSYVNDEEVKETLLEFIKMRKLIKKPLTDFALKKLITKLEKFTIDPFKQVKILEQSILNNWQDIYELKQPNQHQAKASKSSNIFLDMLEEESNNGVF